MSAAKNEIQPTFAVFPFWIMLSFMAAFCCSLFCRCTYQAADISDLSA